MAVNTREVPENETADPGLAASLEGGVRSRWNNPKTIEKGAFTAAIRHPLTPENQAVSWYNFNSRQMNLTTRYFNNLKSIRRCNPELDRGEFPKLVFTV